MKQQINNEIRREEGAFFRNEKKEKYKDCNPTACGNDLLTKDNEFVTKENIHRVCQCSNKAICIEFLRTLDQKVLDQLPDKDV